MIWLTQWLCRSRHCLIAVVWDDQDTTAEAVEREGGATIEREQLDPRCGICGGAVSPEHGRTRFPSIDGGMAALRHAEREQLATRAVLDALGLTIKPQGAVRKPSEKGIPKCR